MIERYCIVIKSKSPSLVLIDGRDQVNNGRAANLCKYLMFLLMFVGVACNCVFAQNWSQVQKTVAADRWEGDLFGTAIAISGDYAIVGAWNEDEDANGSVTLNDAGSVYIYKNAVSTGVDEHEFETTLKVFPNPGNGNYMVDLGEDSENTVVSISDIYGKLIQSKTVTNSQVFEINILEPRGTYIIEFKSGDKNAVILIVKE